MAEALPRTAYQPALPSNSGDLPEVSLDEAHSPLKVLAHADLVRRFAGGEPIRPIHLRIGITGACNMRCNFCNFHSDYESDFYDRFSFKDILPTATSVGLLRDFAGNGGRAVTFCGSGECTTHPGYVEICGAAHEAGLRIGLITNGARLHRPETAACIAATHTWVRVGLNAGTPETFAAITHHKPETFHRLLGTLRGLRAAAAAADFRIGLNYVITVENYREIRLATAHARDAGVHYVRFEPEFYSALGHRSLEAVLPEIAAALDEVAATGDESFEVSIPKLDRGPMDKTEAVEGQFTRCHYSRFVTAIGADGHLYPCPQVHLNSRYRMGSVVEEGYLGVLEGGPREEWESANPLRTDLCKTCFYRPQNELLELIRAGRVDLEGALAEYAVEVPATLHADFV